MVRSLVAATAALVLAGCGLDWSVHEGGAGGGGKGDGGSTGTWHTGNSGGGGEGPGGTKATTTGVTTAASSGEGAATTSTAASTTGGGGAPPCDSGDTSKCAECEICAQNGECAGALDGCNATGGCPDLFNCYFGCADPLCQDNCYNAFAGAVPAFEQLAGCLYCTVCVVSCGPTPRCQ